MDPSQSGFFSVKTSESIKITLETSFDFIFQVKKKKKLYISTVTKKERSMHHI